MEISLVNVSKRFLQHWIFKQINYTFCSGECYAVLGANGSGKSTLIRIIAGMQKATKGEISYTLASGTPLKGNVYEHVSYSAPGLDIIDEFTLKEFFDFHFVYKQPLQGFTTLKIVEEIGLIKNIHQPIGDFSSGMKQRVKLAQAIFTQSDILLLDEPCSHLDNTGLEQYHRWITEYKAGRIVIIASNDAKEYTFCNHILPIEDYK